ncbi:unnamed protein product [Gadus morhua 'NCC']
MVSANTLRYIITEPLRATPLPQRPAVATRAWRVQAVSRDRVWQYRQAALCDPRRVASKRLGFEGVAVGLTLWLMWAGRPARAPVSARLAEALSHRAPENISAIHYVEPDEAPVVVVLEAVEVKVVLYYGSFNHLGFMWPGELCL